MFDQLSEKIQQSFKKLTGKGLLSEKDIDEALRELRMALLEADVNYKVVKSFLANIKQKALTEEVMKSLTPGQQVIKIVNDELIELLGGDTKDLQLSGAKMPNVILLAGVQGSGKTTSAAKLAYYLKNKKNKRVMLAACDMQRAAAVDQLKTLGKKIDVPVYAEDAQNAVERASRALAEARRTGYEILIVDTAGRQHVDEALMDEIRDIHDATSPDEVLFVVDCMMGQMAVDSATAFNERLNITGFILTKADSDARGGAALSVAYVTGRPIRFTGTGEKVEDFEQFHPDRIASRILGKGDVLTLIEKVTERTNAEEQEKLAKKIVKNTFTLQDYLEQIEQVSEMGGLESILENLPGASRLGPISIDEKQMLHTKAIIQSMTVQERNNPKILNASRRRRIAAGSGTTVTEVNRLISGYEQSKKMMKKMANQKGNKRKFGGKNFPFM